MSADRFEIHDHGSKLTVRDTKYGSEVSMLRVRSYSRELTVMAGAIRQQARDIAELEVLAEIGRQWNTDSSLAKWFPLTAERVEQDAQEIAKLRADLAAAVAKRDEWAGGAARLSSQLGNLLAVIHRDGGHYESEHGTEKACADAMQRICDTRAGLGAADELAMLVRRLARALQKAAPDNDLPKTAMDYLSIAGLAGSPMRMDE